ncbi:MAG: GDSL-type esterase/lipase family protein [Planctomycetota bacterium]|jgi:lysophospholipase L1-like esterase/pimeloyl-ACP methyl ester carboxylesterase
MRFKTSVLLALTAVFLTCCSPAGAGGLIRVACVGDSITKGAGAPKGRDYPSQLSSVLGEDYVVGNFGANAATLLRDTRRPYWNHRMFAGAKRFRPDIVVIMLGTNDGKPGHFKDVDNFMRDTRAMARTFLELPSRPRVFLCTPPPVIDDGYGIRTKTLKEQITPLIEQLAKEMDLPLIDCYSPFADKPELLPDKVHPSAEGYGVLAKTVAAALRPQTPAEAEEGRFPGEKKQWEGFDRYEFEFDGRKCFVIMPNEPAAGKPWVWRARFPHILVGDVELLEQGFHVAYMDVGGLFGAPQALKHWDAFYELMTDKYGLAAKVALVGISRGGLPIYRWAAFNPDKVACIVGISPVCDIKSWPGGKGLSGGHGASWQALLKVYGMTEAEALEYKKNPVDLLEPIAKAKIPILHIYSPQDEGVPYEENTKVVAERLRNMGGDFTGVAIEVSRSSIENDPAMKARQLAVDKKNPKAVAGAHRKACHPQDTAAIVAFIVKHATGGE